MLSPSQDAVRTCVYACVHVCVCVCACVHMLLLTGFLRCRQLAILILTALTYAAVCADLMLFVFVSDAVSVAFDLSPRSDVNYLPLIGGSATLILAPVWGMIADRFGRGMVFLCAAALCGLVGAASAFSPSFPVFIVCRVLSSGLLSHSVSLSP
jgi:MFS family permease